MTRQAVNYLVREAGERADLGRVWPHMLRHSCGFALANKGADFRVSRPTVYRTLKLLAECGLASEVAFHDGIARYEHQYNRRSHHHMVCTECGSSVEFFSSEVDRLEQEIGRKHHYLTTRHTFQVYGVCEDCRKKNAARRVV